MPRSVNRILRFVLRELESFWISGWSDVGREMVVVLVHMVVQVMVGLSPSDWVGPH